jgi:hypothetical protein
MQREGVSQLPSPQDSVVPGGTPNDPPQSKSVEDELLVDLAALADRPYDFVLWAFPGASRD